MRNSTFALPRCAAAAAFLWTAAPSQATIVVNIGGQTFASASGQPLPAGTMLQLISCGLDGIPNTESNPGDGSKRLRLDDANPNQWVMGDDSVLAVAFTTGGGAAGDYPSAAAFDLAKGSDTPGTLDRVFEFLLVDLVTAGVVPGTTKLALRWFPGLQASNYSSIRLQPGQTFGEFTRLSNPRHGGDLWAVPSDGANVTFDPLVTTDMGGFDPVTAGWATFVVIPEPSSVGLLLSGSAALLAGRRRESRMLCSQPR